MEFPHREHISKVGWSAICDGELVYGDTLVFVVADLVKALLASWFQNLFPPYPLNGTRVWVIGVVL